MTETQTPECADCGDTGYIPPFMDECSCGRALWAHTSAAPVLTPPFSMLDGGEFDLGIDDDEDDGVSPLPDPLGLQVGDFKLDDHGETVVWGGAEWLPVPTESLSVGEYYEKYPVEPTAAEPLAVTDEQVEAEAIAALAYAATASVVDDEELAPTLADALSAAAAADAMTELGETAYVTGEVIADSSGLFREVIAEDESEYLAAITADITAKAVVTPAKPAPGSGRPMSPKQEELLTRLVAERDKTNSVVAAAVKAMDDSPVRISAKHASRLIEGLMSIPANPALKPPRPNKYDGSCKTCHGHVAAGTGRIEQVDGKWTTFHLTGGCMSAAAKEIADVLRVDEPGLYKFVEKDGTIAIYRVRLGRSSKRLYAERIHVGEADEHGHRHVAFAYNANAMSFLSKTGKLTWQEARDFGAMYGNCVACGRNLHDPRSVVQMYGATCASHFGWPTVTLKQAEGIIAGAMTWEEVTGLLV